MGLLLYLFYVFLEYWKSARNHGWLRNSEFHGGRLQRPSSAGPDPNLLVAANKVTIYATSSTNLSLHFKQKIGNKTKPFDFYLDFWGSRGQRSCVWTVVVQNNLWILWSRISLQVSRKDKIQTDKQANNLLWFCTVIV